MSKNAIVVLSFGTSYIEPRKKSIEAIENEFREYFKEYSVFRAFTSPTIIKNIKKNEGIEILNQTEILNYLKENGYTRVTIQPLHILNGIEYDVIKKITEDNKEYFEHLEVGAPLFTDEEDYIKSVEAITKEIGEIGGNEAVVFMGHGTAHYANAAYTALEYFFHDSGFENIFIGTVEGFPTINQVLKKLKKKNISKIKLMPFMLVAGDHALNDMAGDDDDSWKSILEKEGYEVEVFMQGIGENKDIRNIYKEHCIKALGLSNE